MRPVSLLFLAACATTAPNPGSRAVPEPPTTSVPVRVVDAFVAEGWAAADVLFVVDDADAFDRDALVDAFPAMVDAMDAVGLDWRVGVVSTDLTDPAESGAVLGEVRAGDPDPAAAFAAAVGAVGGESVPQGLGAAALALDAGFRRPDAALLTILVSPRADATDPSVVTPAEFVATHPEGEGSELTAIAADEVLLAVAREGGLFGPYPYPEVDWAAALAELGSVARSYRTSFPLSAVPQEDTLAVEVETVGGVLLAFENEGPQQFEFDAATNEARLLGGYVPDYGAVVRVSYVPEP
jgi:hypothetical protein